MNFQSQEWREVVEQVEAAIDALKETLCAQMPETQSAYYRGGIAMLRKFLTWPAKEAEAKQPHDEGIDFSV